MVTTTLPPPVGINWQAVVTAYLNTLFEPSIGNTVESSRDVGLTINPRIGQRAPEQLALFATPTIGGGAGSKENAGDRLSLTPSIGMGTNPNAVLNLSATPSIGGTGAPIDTGTLGLTITPSIGMTGTGIAAVSYESTGVGTQVIASTASWSHTIGGNGLVVSVGAQSNVSTAAVTAKVGTTNMTKLGASPQFNNGGYLVWSVIFGLLSPPTGTQTISLAISGGGTTVLAGNSVSYNNLGSFGTCTSSTGSSSSPALSVPSARGQMVAENLRYLE